MMKKYAVFAGIVPLLLLALASFNVHQTYAQVASTTDVTTTSVDASSTSSMSMTDQMIATSSAATTTDMVMVENQNASSTASSTVSSTDMSVGSEATSTVDTTATGTSEMNSPNDNNNVIWVADALVPCTDQSLCIGSWNGQQWMWSGYEMILWWDGSQWVWVDTSIPSLSNGTSSTTSGTTTPVTDPTQNLSMSFSPSQQTVSTGQRVDFKGTGFSHEEDVGIYLNGTLVSKAHADGAGNFTTGSLSTPSTAGTYTYTVMGMNTGVTMTSSVTVQ